MKYQVGDKILILHSKEEATIVDILDKEMLQVEVQGVQFPVFMDQVDFPYYYQFSSLHKKEKQPVLTKTPVVADSMRVEKTKQKNQEGVTGLQLIVFPVFSKELAEENMEVERLKLYLQNGLSKKIQFSYQGQLQRIPEWQLDGSLEAGDDFYLHDILLEQFNDSPIFQFTFRDNTTEHSVVHSIRIKPKQLFEQLQLLQSQQKASFSILITSELVIKENILATYTESIATTSSTLIPAKNTHHFEASFDHVLDLHIDKILPDYKGLSNFEILTIQMAAFEKKVETALTHHQVSLTVIHGVGKGKLKEEIHQWLRDKAYVKQFSNTYDPLYGAGATTILFQY